MESAAIISTLFNTLFIILLIMAACIPLYVIYMYNKTQKQKELEKEQEISDIVDRIKDKYTELSEEGLRSTAYDIIKRRNYKKMITTYIEGQVQEVKTNTTLKSALIDDIRVDYDSSGVYYGNKNDYGYLSKEDYRALMNELEQAGYKCSYNYYSRGPGWDVYRGYYSKLKVSW